MSGCPRHRLAKEKRSAIRLTDVGKSANISKRNGQKRIRPTRPVSWLTPARKAFEAFPDGARQIVIDALSVAAEGGMAGIAKPMKGLGSGVFEVALPFRGNAFRVVYAVQLGDEL